MRLFLLLLTLIFAIDGIAQFQLPNTALNNVHTTIPGTFRGYGMDALKGIYTIYFDDGKHYSGSGSIKKDGDKQVLKVRDLNGNKRSQKAGGTTRLIFEPEGTSMFNKNRVIYQFVTVDNLYWMASAGGSIPELYYAIQQPNVAAIRKGNNIEIASLEDIMKIIGHHPKARKFALKGDYDKAFAEFNGTSTSMYRSGRKGNKENKDEE